jgi:hypothetical protein
MHTSKLLFSIGLFTALFISSCSKNNGTPVPDLPWYFTLTDNTLKYSLNAQTYGAGFDGDYPYINSTSNTDSSSFRVQTTAYSSFGNTSYLQIDIGIISMDSVLARKLSSGINKNEKAALLKNYFFAGRIFSYFNTSLNNNRFFIFYTPELESSKTFAINIYNLPVSPGDQLKVISSAIWDDGTVLPKIKIEFEYTAHVQEYNNIGVFTGTPRLISGVMKTFFQLSQ